MALRREGVADRAGVRLDADEPVVGGELQTGHRGDREAEAHDALVGEVRPAGAAGAERHAVVHRVGRDGREVRPQHTGAHADVGLHPGDVGAEMRQVDVVEHVGEHAVGTLVAVRARRHGAVHAVDRGVVVVGALDLGAQPVAEPPAQRARGHETLTEPGARRRLVLGREPRVSEHVLQQVVAGAEVDIRSGHRLDRRGKGRCGEGAQGRGEDQSSAQGGLRCWGGRAIGAGQPGAFVVATAAARQLTQAGARAIPGRCAAGDTLRCRWATTRLSRVPVRHGGIAIGACAALSARLYRSIAASPRSIRGTAWPTPQPALTTPGSG